ncbi:rhodanese-like domain-containing protein [Halobacteriaceae archaeon GCM10025711]
MVEEISADAVRRKVEAGEDVQIIDVRPAREFRAGHIPGAENIPFPEFVQRVADHEWRDEVVFVCPHGESSRQAGRLLESYEGIDADETRVANMTDGYEAWTGEVVEE